MTINEKLKLIAENIPKVHTAGQRTAPSEELYAQLAGTYIPSEGTNMFSKIVVNYNPAQYYADEYGNLSGYFSNKITSLDSPFASMLNGLDTSKVTAMRSCFRQCTALTTVLPLDYTAVKDATQMYAACTSLESLPEWFSLPNAEIVQNLFDNAFNRTAELPDVEFPSAIDASGLFTSARCKSVGNVSLPNATTLKQLFMSSALERIGDIYAPLATNVYQIVEYSSKLVSVGRLDLRNLQYTGSYCITGYSCSKLEEIGMKNIPFAFDLHYSPLSTSCLVSLIYEALRNPPYKRMFVGSTNLAKLADVYVRVLDEIEITDEMRAADDLIDEKLPFVRCEATDEGAILITDYIILKNWSIA